MTNIVVERRDCVMSGVDKIDKTKLYKKLFESFKKYHGHTPVTMVQKMASQVWKGYKKQAKSNEELQALVDERSEEMRRATKKESNLLMDYFTTVASTSENQAEVISVLPRLLKKTKAVQCDDEDKLRLKPAQDASEKRISTLEDNLNQLCAQRDLYPCTEIDEQITILSKQVKDEKQILKRKRQNAEYQKKHRDAKKRMLDDICSKNPDIKKKLSIRNTIGRPCIEQDQPMLGQTIDEIIGPVNEDGEPDMPKSLSEITQELKSKGFNISRSGTYLRLLQRNAEMAEARRTKRSSKHDRSHADCQFAQASVRYLETLASVLGPSQVMLLYQDDRVRVPISVTTDSKPEPPLMMDLEYRVTLPDRDWVYAERHKLIPTIYAGVVIEPGGFEAGFETGITGPTFIAVRSGAHTLPSSNTHALDFETLLDVPEFQAFARTEDGSVKPVVIIHVNGGADESPRYHKTIGFAVEHFKRFDLDGFFIVTNAPGLKPLPRVERRLLPLSVELTELVLPRDQFGSHLDEHGRTLDEDLERSNLEFAGKVVAEVWNNVTVENHPVHACYVEPGELDLPEEPDVRWYANHVCESQYLVQIVKCRNLECCCSPRSALFRVLPDRFLPPPVRIKQTATDLLVCNEGEFLGLYPRLALKIHAEAKGFPRFPYDYNCPSVKPILSKRICKECGLYHASVRSANRHRDSLHWDLNYMDKSKESRIQPMYITARRDNELMCVVRAQNGDEDIEWLDEEEVEDIGEACYGSTEPTRSVIIKDETSEPGADDVSAVTGESVPEDSPVNSDS